MSGISPDMAPAAWDAYHRDVLRRLRPGITMLIVHLREDTRAERESFAAHDGGWGADWRARDMRAMSDAEFRRLAQAEGVHLVTWRDLGRATTLCRGNGS
ncbi:MAG: hypothetical protein IPJ56_11620 [Gemmatimonadetes bacterium]|jgi:hypothetical protein|nr:hypothetical protein [Gemmatimonadota bacterium]